MYSSRPGQRLTSCTILPAVTPTARSVSNRICSVLPGGGAAPTGVRAGAEPPEA